jgi:regulator of replication initiation timing
LDELLLVSFRERAARRVRFHPRTTLLIGQNSTGKSSIIKSIYYALGADPAVWSESWRDAQVATALRFRIDDTAMTIVRHGGTFSLYDASGGLIDTFTRVTDGVGPAIARLFDFELRLGDQRGHQVTPPPAFLFLPYYIDQDASWQRPWAGFARLGQLPRWQQPLAEYHTGLRPNEYYRVKSIADRARRRVGDASAKLAALQEAQQSVQGEASGTLFQLDAEEFRNEVQELLAESRRLDIDERKYRTKLRDLQAQRTVVSEQRRATARALQEAQKDLAFATALEGHAVECPACGALYENSFSNRFAIAEDEARCRELMVEMDSELRRLDAAIESTETTFKEAVERRTRLRALLSEQRGPLALHDVIKAEGRAEVRRVFRTGLDGLAAEVRAAEVEVEESERQLRRIGDPERRRRVLQLYQDRMREHLRELDVVLSSAAYADVVPRISETGSERPRALLAYFYAVLHTMREYSSSVFCPVVIDSPNQQAQDDINHESVLRFLFERRPAGSQLVVGLESARDVPRDVLADAEVIELPPEPKRSILERTAYEDVGAVVSRLLTDSFRLTSPE